MSAKTATNFITLALYGGDPVSEASNSGRLILSVSTRDHLRGSLDWQMHDTLFEHQQALDNGFQLSMP